MSAIDWQIAHERPAVGCLLCGLLPRRIKRMLLLASLYNFLTSEEFEHSIGLLKLNRELGLCERPDALRFPVAVSATFWGRKRPAGFSVPDQRGPLYKLAEDILKQSPKSLRYGSAVEMRTDVLHLLTMVV